MSFSRTKPYCSSNLDCFLECTTPSVPSNLLPKSCITDLNNLWQPLDQENIEFFTLGDLWDCYDEWSAYGAGTPVVLNRGETVVQYYVPYLSAIQIYISKSFTNLMNQRDESDSGESEFQDSYSDFWSDDGKSEKLSRSLSNSSRGTWDGTSDDSSFDQEGFWPMRERLGYLYFQYFETSPPYSRIPLMDKINELTENHPGLISLRNVDLSPASWMAVAWYPIYHIPTGKTVKDLSACFLTYHTLSSSFQVDESEYGNTDLSSTRRETEDANRGCVSLTPFGLATYKMQGNLWINPESSSDQERMICLHSAADSWLKQLRVQHHDFIYFSSHSR